MSSAVDAEYSCYVIRDCTASQVWPLFLGDDEHIIEEEQIVALNADSLPENAEIISVHSQLTALLQPARWRH